MATFGNYPAKYLLFNQQLSKQLAIVMKIEGISDVFGIADTFTTVRYGDPGLVYGLPGLVYGGLRKIGGSNGVGGVKPYIQLDSGMIIQQRIEPEQGKGSVSNLTLSLIDKNGEVSYLLAPGNVVDEIMTSKQVTIYIGFTQTSFPEDYVILYRGYITSLVCPPGVVKFQLSDGTMKSRQPVFSTPTTNLDSPINSGVTSIPVVSTSGFYAHILGPNATYDPIVHTYIMIDSEIMEYGSAGIPNSTHFTVTRGSLGSVATSHNTNANVTNTIMFGANVADGGVNFITLALKLLLSGWNGPCETNIALASLGYQDLTTSPPTTVLNAFVLAVDDADLDLGLTVGDYFYITGATNGANNISGTITGFAVLNSFTKIIYINTVFNSLETPTLSVSAFRSKYDTLPTVAGSKCRMRDVDVSTMEAVRSNYFTSGIFQVAIYYDAPVFAKDAIASDLFLPMGCYEISRYGRISMSVTKPPLPGATGKLVELNWTNVINPESISVTRATNNRTFYNQVSYQYDYDVVLKAYTKINYYVDTVSLNQFQQSLTLPITAKAIHTVLGGGSVSQSRGQSLLTRYKRVALMISITVNWSVGSLIEVSDVVLLNDDGKLKIMNFQTGLRDIGSQLFEVIDRTYDVTNGNVKLKLLGGLGFSVTSRFGLISPSTILASGCTTTTLRLTPSYGQTAITKELAKWTPFFGLPIVVHNPDYTLSSTSTLVSLDLSDPTAIDIFPALGFTPSAGDILEIADYPTDTNPNTNSKYKALYSYLTPTVSIVSGLSTTQFTVAAGDVSKFIIGNTLIIRKLDYSIYSQEVKISNVTGVTIIVDQAFRNQTTNVPFTPDSTYVAEGLGFLDKLGYFRYD